MQSRQPKADSQCSEQDKTWCFVLEETQLQPWMDTKQVASLVQCEKVSRETGWSIAKVKFRGKICFQFLCFALSLEATLLKNTTVRSNRIRQISFHLTNHLTPALVNRSSNKKQFKIEYSLFCWESVAAELHFFSSSVYCTQPSPEAHPSAWIK